MRCAARRTRRSTCIGGKAARLDLAIPQALDGDIAAERRVRGRQRGNDVAPSVRVGDLLVGPQKLLERPVHATAPERLGQRADDVDVALQAGVELPRERAASGREIHVLAPRREHAGGLAAARPVAGLQPVVGKRARLRQRHRLERERDRALQLAALGLTRVLLGDLQQLAAPLAAEREDRGASHRDARIGRPP